jgi:hypothetical protein
MADLDGCRPGAAHLLARSVGKAGARLRPAQAGMGRKIHIRRIFNGFSDHRAVAGGIDDAKYRLAWIKYMYVYLIPNRNCVALKDG